jgi:Family of unknown function (DUF6361)
MSQSRTRHGPGQRGGPCFCFWLAGPFGVGGRLTGEVVSCALRDSLLRSLKTRGGCLRFALPKGGASLTWLDHDATDREWMNRILAMFRERDTRDELGIGVIRDLLAGEFFPGTSTIQTRLRYMRFVPWIYQRLEQKPLADALEDAGCTSQDILDHCRQPGEHCRGCWVADLLLGKE